MHDADQAFLDLAGDVTAALQDVPLPTALFDQEGMIRWQNTGATHPSSRSAM